MRGFERPDALGQPRLERQIVGEASEQRLAEVDVGLNKTWKNDETPTINDRRFRPSARPPVRPSDFRDSSIGDQHVRIQHSTGGIHRYHPPAAQQQRFAQVEIRGFASALSEGGRSK